MADIPDADETVVLLPDGADRGWIYSVKRHPARKIARNLLSEGDSTARFVHEPAGKALKCPDTTALLLIKNI